MLRNRDMWHAIDELARINHFSCSGMARAAGLDPTTFNPSKRKTKYGQPRWLSLETIAKILDLTGTSFTEFAKYLDRK
ncbi:MAG: hypothetical protein IKP24_02450 [Alphaproteobacteria bacterium]|nr:hypothetical protein [Alphaproteobacteria bacterium]